MINNVVLVGRLTKDPELKMTPSGIAVTRFTIAINRPFTGQGGEKKADFINCIAWRKQAENLANFMRKGGLIGLTGRIETGSYEGQDGKRVYTTDVIADSIQFLESKNSGSGSNAPLPEPPPEPYGNEQKPPYNAPQQKPQQSDVSGWREDVSKPIASGGQSVDITEDDLPF